jgi:hypothetical protein
LSKGSLIPDEPGGWTRDGEWEEFDQYERERLEMEMLKERKEWKWQMKLKEEQASDALLDPEDEFDSEPERGMQEEGERYFIARDLDRMLILDLATRTEPPLDILSGYELPLPSPFDHSAAHLPSLASSVSSSPFLGSASLAPSPASDQVEDVAMSNSSNGASEEIRTRSIRAFEATLLEATCPACAEERSIRGDETGARCEGCDWGIRADVLHALELAFAAHG